MAQVGFKINIAKCVGCKACSVACNQEMNTVPGVRYRRVVEKREGTYPTPRSLPVTMACFHCEHPACLVACPQSPNKADFSDEANCIRKDPRFGIVLIDQDTCTGCRYCVAACPYGAPQYNAATQKVEKCTLCVHRVLDESGTALTGFVPACVTTCIGGALEFTATAPNTGEVPGGFASREHTHPSVTFDWGWLQPW